MHVAAWYRATTNSGNKCRLARRCQISSRSAKRCTKKRYKMFYNL